MRHATGVSLTSPLAYSRDPGGLVSATSRPRRASLLRTARPLHQVDHQRLVVGRSSSGRIWRSWPSSEFIAGIDDQILSTTLAATGELSKNPCVSPKLPADNPLITCSRQPSPQARRFTLPT